MGDSACLMHGFSYASAIPNHSKQGNAMHVLGESISFGRFIHEPLSWDKWSAFPHKKYVEEAASYAQPGSVAAKKAFFEAHYKRIAAQKAAALLEQENAARIDANLDSLQDVHAADYDKKVVVISDPEFDVAEKMEVSKIKNDEINDNRHSLNDVISMNLESQDTVSCSEGSATPQMERPLLKNCEDVSSVMSKKKSGLSSLKSSIRRKTWRVPSTPAKPVTPNCKKVINSNQSTKKSAMDSMDRKRSSPKSLRGLVNLIPIKQPDKEPVSAIKKDCKTPLRTPVVAATKGVVKYPASTPQSENRRIKAPIDPSALECKTAGPKWHILSSVCSKSLTACRSKLQSPTSSTPFVLRTEERAAKRKQKLEEKFNANEEHKAQLQKTLKEKAGNEFRKISCGFCFKARPLPDFYKERETSINQKKIPVTRPQTAVLGRSIPNKTISVPPSRPLDINGVSKNPSKKNIVKTSKFHTTSLLPERMRHENKSPNIQH